MGPRMHAETAGMPPWYVYIYIICIYMTWYICIHRTQHFPGLGRGRDYNRARPQYSTVGCVKARPKCRALGFSSLSVHVSVIYATIHVHKHKYCESLY